jgi:hypothetical protein
MSRLCIRNRTQYPSDEVAALVRYACSELDLPSKRSVLVRVSHTRIRASRRVGDGRWMYGASGRAFNCVHRAPDVPRGAAYEVLLHVGRPDDFPVCWYDRGYPGVTVGELHDWREGLVCIAAHELKHVEGYQRGVHVHNRKMTRREEEARCDAYASSVLTTWRASAGGER